MILFLLQKVDVHGVLPYVPDLSPCRIFAQAPGSYSEDQRSGLLVYSLVLGVVCRSDMHGLSLNSIYCCLAPVALLCILYKCAGFLRRCCGESNMFAGPVIVLLLYHPLTEVSLPGLSHIVLVV